MKIALEYGVLPADVETQIAFFQSLDVSHVTLGAWAIPGYADVGYLTPELVGPIKEPLDEAGISIDGFWFGENNIRLMLDPDKGEDIVARFCRSLGTMKQFGIPLAPVMNVVRVEDEAQRDGLWARMIELYKRLTETAEQAGVTIASHTHWTPRHLVWNTETLLQLLNDVPSPRNKALFCAGSVWSAEDDVRESVERLGHRIGMVHFRDSRERLGKCEEIPLGTGLTEFRDIVEALDRMGYDGLIRPEHIGAVAGEEGRTASMAMAIGFIRGLMHSVGVSEG
ncbi:MAG: TIM barrel protein [Armatimonadota bacterium]